MDEAIVEAHRKALSDYLAKECGMVLKAKALDSLSRAALAVAGPMVMEPYVAFVQKYIDAWDAGTGTVYLIDDARNLKEKVNAGE